MSQFLQREAACFAGPTSHKYLKITSEKCYLEPCLKIVICQWVSSTYLIFSYWKQVWYIPQTFFGQQALSSMTCMITSPSLSQTGGGSSLHSGSTATMLPFSKQLYMQQPLMDPFQISPAERGCPLLSVHAETKNIISLQQVESADFLQATMNCIKLLHKSAVEHYDQGIQEKMMTLKPQMNKCFAMVENKYWVQGREPAHATPGASFFPNRSTSALGLESKWAESTDHCSLRYSEALLKGAVPDSRLLRTDTELKHHLHWAAVNISISAKSLCPAALTTFFFWYTKVRVRSMQNSAVFTHTVFP